MRSIGEGDENVHRLDRIALIGVTVSVKSGVVEALDRLSPSPRCAAPARRDAASGCGASAARRLAANSEQRAAALGAVALPAGTTVGQGHLPRVGDGDLLAADAPALRAGVLWL
jgi:hypothetical protein